MQLTRINTSALTRPLLQPWASAVVPPHYQPAQAPPRPAAVPNASQAYYHSAQVAGVRSGTNPKSLKTTISNWLVKLVSDCATLKASSELSTLRAYLIKTEKPFVQSTDYQHQLNFLPSEITTNAELLLFTLTTDYLLSFEPAKQLGITATFNGGLELIRLHLQKVKTDAEGDCQAKEKYLTFRHGDNTFVASDCSLGDQQREGFTLAGSPDYQFAQLPSVLSQFLEDPTFMPLTAEHIKALDPFPEGYRYN
jgi:hypothetical protein